MNSLITELWGLTKMGRIQGVDLILGEKLQNLHALMLQKPEEIPEDMESLFIQLFTINNRHISVVNAHYIGLCIVLYYKSLKKPSYWTILPVFQEEVLKQNKPAIVIFGIFTRHLCDSFKSKLPPSITFLLQCTTESLQPTICQFFRRVIKGSGSFLKSSVQEIFGFVFRGASSINEELRIEAVKTIPCLMSCAHIPRKKLLPIVGLSLASTSRALRDATAKSLSKIMLISTKEQRDDDEQNDKYFNIAFKIILQFMTNEKNIPTLSLAFNIFLHYFEPIEIVRKFRVFAKLALSMSAFPIPFSSLCLMTRSIFTAISNVTGKSAGLSLNHFMVEKLDPDNISPSKAAVIMDSLINFDASSKILAKAAKAFYPLLTSERNDLRRLVIALFAKLGAKEQKAAQVLLDSFMKWVSSEDAKQADIDGFSRGAAILVMTSNSSEESLTKIANITVNWLKQISKFESPRIHAAILLLSSVLYKKADIITPEIISVVCTFLTKYLKSFSLKNPSSKQAIKFIACFFLQSVRKPPSNFSLMQPVIKQFFSCMFSNAQQISAPAILAFLHLAKRCRFIWEKDSNIAPQICNLIINSFERFYSFNECDNDYNMPKFEANLDQTAFLYGVDVPLHVNNKIDPSMVSLYSYLIGEEHCSRSVQLCKECLHDIGLWTLLCQQKQQRNVINQVISSNHKEASTLAASLSLLRAMFQKKCVKEAPTKTLSILLQMPTFGNRRCIRLLAATLAAYICVIPKLIPKVLDIIEQPRIPAIFTSFLIAELDFSVVDEQSTIRCLLILQRILLTTNTPEGVFALAHIAKQKAIPADFIGQMVSVIEQIVYSNFSLSPISQFFITKAIEYLNPTNNQEELYRITHCFFEFAAHKSLARILAIKIMRLVNKYEDYMPQLRLLTNSTAPLPLLVNRFYFPATIEDAGLLFMILQQSQDQKIEDYLMKIFEANSDVKKWTDLCKRVVIIGCVPPAERKGDIRIVPTFRVLLCAIKIAEKLVQKIRDGFPNNMTCVDDIVSIAFNSIRMNEPEFDSHCFNTMTDVVRLFSNVRNKECAMLELYTSQFVPSLKYATNGTHDAESGARFCLAYLAFLMESRSPFLGEATSTLVEGLGKIGFTESNSAVFCRIVGRLFTLLEKDDQRLTELFTKAANLVFSRIFKQQRKISEFGLEMQFVIAAFLDLNKSKEMKRALTLILLEELQNNCCSMVLNTLTTLFEQVGAQLFDIEFAVSVLAHSELIVEEWQKGEDKAEDNKEDEEEDNLDNTSFWLIPTKRIPAVSRFLTAVSSLIPSPLTKDWENVWRYVLSLSITGRVCYPAIARLVNCASNSVIAEIGPSLVIEILNHEEGEAQMALIYYILSKMPAKIISAMFIEISSAKASLVSRFSVIRTAIRFGGIPNNKALDCIAGVISAALFPDGFAFIASLLADEKTAKIAFLLLKLGVADAIDKEARSSIIYAPKILHFLRLSCQMIKKVAPEAEEDFNDAVAEITVTLLSTVAHIKDRKPVVIPACAILKSIGKSSAQKAFESADMKTVIESLSPPRYAHGIQLKAFGDVKSRKSSSGSGGWQTLEIGDSSDED